MAAAPRATPQPNALLTAALDYAARGIPVFPLHHTLPDETCSCGDAKCIKNRGKHPRTKHGHKEASTDPAQIRYWWRTWPQANIGMPTGAASGRAVIDEDPRNGGDAGPLRLPPTLTVLTWSGGRHFHYLPPADHPNVPGDNTGKIAKGIDCKAEGGYVLLPPSTICGKSYRWEDEEQPLAPLPARILTLLTAKPKPLRQRAEPAPQVRVAERDDRDAYWLDWAMERSSAGTGDQTGYLLAQQLLLDPNVRNADAVLAEYAQRATLDASDPFDERSIDRWLKSASTSRMVLGGEPAKSQVARPLPARPKLRALPPVKAPENMPQNIPGDSEPPTDEPQARPQIVAKGRQLYEITAEALGALEQANNPPFLFQRSRALVRVVSDENHRPVIDEMDEKAVTCRLTDIADFVRMAKTGSTDETEPKFSSVSISPPADLVKNVLAQPHWDFPALVGVTEAPFVRPDGSLCITPGYDPATRLIYAPTPGLRIPNVPDRPAKRDVAKALALLEDVIADFPFDGEASKAHALAVLLTTAVRPAIRGLVPLALVTAPTAGTGKGLLTSAIITINTGRAAAMMVAAEKEEEWSKRITATLLEGPAFIVIDNIRGTLKSAALESVLTTPVWKDRVLGFSRVPELPQRAVWLATGNNLQLGGDMPRRCYRIRLDAKMVRPERREVFKHPDLKGYVSEHRGAILGAMLTVARAWYADGCPAYKVTPMGSFEEWSRIIGCILEHAGVPGFLTNLDEMYEEADTERPQWGAFLTAWYKLFDSEPKTASQLAAYICNANDSDELRGALPDDLAPALVSSGLLSKKLAYHFRSLSGTRFDADNHDIWLDSQRDKVKNVTKWRVFMSN